MAYKEVSRVEIAEVIRQWQAGRGIRELNRSTGISRNTIRKYILTAQNCGLGPNGPPPTDLQLAMLMQLNQAGPREIAAPTDKALIPWTEKIEQWLKQDKLKLVRIQDLLAQQHCLVAYTCLRRYVSKRGWFLSDSTSQWTPLPLANGWPLSTSIMDFHYLGHVHAAHT